MYAIIVGFGLLFAFYGIPESRAMTVDDIDRAIPQMLWWASDTTSEHQAGPMLATQAFVEVVTD